METVVENTRLRKDIWGEERFKVCKKAELQNMNRWLSMKNNVTLLIYLSYMPTEEM